MSPRKNLAAPAPAEASQSDQPIERPAHHPQPESDLLKAFKVAYRALNEIEESSRHHDHGVTYLGDVALRAKLEVERMLS